MPAKIITITNQKGGAGKTTLAMQLAGNIGKTHRVFVVDADPQGSASRWAKVAAATFPATIANFFHAGEKIHLEIKKLIDNYDYIIVDCLPSVDSFIPQRVLLISDLALIPIIPSPPDLWASIGIQTVIQNASTLNPHLKARLVINQHQVNTTLAKEVRDILKDFQIPLTQNLLRQRTAYRQSAAIGGTVHELTPVPSVATQELDALTAEVLTLLHP